jgi:methanethiol S-methyltransferase
VQGPLRAVAWFACVVYSTIPAFWLLIHPRVDFWRSRRRSPYRILLPLWFVMWLLMAAITVPWRSVIFYANRYTWIPAVALFCAGLLLYRFAHAEFSLSQLGGLPELLPGNNQQRLVTTGIRARVRHPVYLGHLCEMLAWSLGTGLAVCWALTAFAIATGMVMIATEDQELEKRFGQTYGEYKASVPAIVPRLL